jgi:hypothetical protein
MGKMNSSIILLFTIIVLIMTIGSFSHTTAENQTIQPFQVNQSPSSSLLNVSGNFSQITSDGVKKANTSSTDHQFLFLMNQYWIPDLYDIKGRIDGAAGFGADIPQMLNLSADYARIRLIRNINETNEYPVSPAVNNLKTQYQTGALRMIRAIDGIMALNRSEETFARSIPMRTAAFSLYGSWLEYQVMRCYILPNMTYPEIATVSSDQFMEVMGYIAP